MSLPAGRSLSLSNKPRQEHLLLRLLAKWVFLTHGDMNTITIDHIVL